MYLNKERLDSIINSAQCLANDSSKIVALSKELLTKCKDQRYIGFQDPEIADVAALVGRINGNKDSFDLMLQRSVTLLQEEKPESDPEPEIVAIADADLDQVPAEDPTIGRIETISH